MLKKNIKFIELLYEDFVNVILWPFNLSKNLLRLGEKEKDLSRATSDINC